MRCPKDPKATWFVRTHAEASRGRLSHQKKKPVENYPHSNTNQLPFFTRIQNPSIENPSIENSIENLIENPMHIDAIERYHGFNPPNGHPILRPGATPRTINFVQLKFCSPTMQPPRKITATLPRTLRSQRRTTGPKKGPKKSGGFHQFHQPKCSFSWGI